MPVDVPIEHTIELRDNTPVSTQPRRIPYGQGEEIQGNCHLLVINDHFTKLYPVKDRTAPTTAKCIVDFCLTLFWTGSGRTLYWTGGGKKAPPG